MFFGSPLTSIQNLTILGRAVRMSAERSASSAGQVVKDFGAGAAFTAGRTTAQSGNFVKGTKYVAIGLGLSVLLVGGLIVRELIE